MTQPIAYGKLSKRIVFTDTDHRHAKLLIKLKHDGLTQADFFRNLVTGYINDDDRIQDYVDEIKKMSKTRKQKSKKLREIGKTAARDLSLSGDEIESIFDLIEEEHAEL